MSSLWASLQTKEKSVTNVANADGDEQIDPPRGAPLRAGIHIAFKPMAPLEHSSAAPRDDFMDLIMDDPPPPRKKPFGEAGRPRVYNSNAERQAAYRDRKKQRA